MKKVLAIFSILSGLVIANTAMGSTSNMEAISGTGRFVNVKMARVSLVRAAEKVVGIDIELKRSVAFENVEFINEVSGDFSYKPVSRPVERLNVVTVSTDVCGSVYYEAIQPIPGDFEIQSFMTLVDHRERVCEDKVPGSWEAELIHDLDIESVLVLVGSAQN